MYNDRIKEVLNKIDYNLKEIFENVEIKRLEDTKEQTFEIKLSGVKNNEKNKAELVILMSESTMFNGSVIWKYKTNPLNEDSMMITRTSTVGSMAMDIEDIITENRFAKEYLESLFESVNESVENNEEEEVDSIDESFEFDFEEEVLVEGIEGIIIDRERLEVNNVRYNIYQVYLEGIQKQVFEYDINKK